MKLSKTQIAIPSAIVLLAAIAGGAQLWGQHEARLRVEQTLAALPAGATGHYQQLDYNVFTRTLRLTGLAIAENGQPFLSVHRAVLHHLSGEGSDANPLHADTINVTELDAWRGGHRITVSHAIVKDAAFLAPGLPSPPTTPLWLRSTADGTLLSAGSIAATDIADDNGTTLAAVSATGYDDGKLREASARDFADRQGNRIATLAAEQIDLGGLDRVFDTGRYTIDAASWTGLRPLIGHAEISGFVTKGSHGSSSIDHMTLDGFAARPFALSPTGAHCQTDAFRRDAAEAVSLSNFSLGGLTFSDKETGTSGSLGQITVSGYQAGSLAHFALNDWSVTSPHQATVSVGQMQLTKFDASGLLAKDADLAPEDWITAVQTGEVKLGGMEVAKVAAHLPGNQTVTLQALKESVSGTNPLATQFSLQGLSLPASISPSLQGLLEPLGIETLVLDFDEAGSFDQTTGSSTLDHVVLTAAGLGSLSLSGQFANLPRSVTDSADPMTVLSQIGIGHAKLSFTNQTLVQKIIVMMAKRSGQSEAQITSGARTAASFMAAAVVPDQADAGQQIGAFIADPKTLTITTAPVKPVPVAGLLGPNLRAAQSALNLQLSAD
ncbi:hypothetical protein [Acidisoma sp.]|uniref:hypothetical protein n=1 Tax=Acidisoma sp. TaxID=1872115 RepID=UPI002D7F650B|nr:hypothetical protein [Acidisoma sp.]